MTAAPLESHRAPLHVAGVTLRARDPAALAAFYAGIGFAPLGAEGEALLLGAGGDAFLRIVPATAPPAPAPRPGLFHAAVLLPTRADLGRWLSAALAAGVRLTGASDHGVSEALYLDDAEGNGIEIYADRPRGEWPRDGTGYAMTTRRMDMEAVTAEGRRAGPPGPALPDGAGIGHVHLRAGDAAAAERFLTGALDLTVTHRRPGAVWLGAGGYHHHLAANDWDTAGAPPAAPGAPGLAEVTIAVTDPAAWDRLTARAGADRLTDPWGTAFRLVRG
jgi:catechol 2,3-dioxygenase